MMTFDEWATLALTTSISISEYKKNLPSPPIFRGDRILCKASIQQCREDDPPKAGFDVEIGYMTKQWISKDNLVEFAKWVLEITGEAK